MMRSLSSIRMESSRTKRPPRYNPDYIWPSELDLFGNKHPHYQALKYTGPEMMVGGPANTGKTHVTVSKGHKLACLYPGSVGYFVKKTKESIKTTIIPTYYDVLGYNAAISPGFVKGYGGVTPYLFQYANGSEIRILGLNDPAELDSTQPEWIYVNQAEQLELDDWQKLTIRCRGSKMPYNIVFGDCNPTFPQHFLCPYLENQYRRDSILYLPTHHEHNPILFNQEDGSKYPKGIAELDKLDKLTGTQRARYRDGQWIGNEGLVYDYLQSVYLIERGKLPDISQWNKYRAVDFGYGTFVCIWVAQDPLTKTSIVYREYRKAEGIVEDHAREIQRLSQGETILGTIADHDAEDAATLHRYGIPTIKAIKDIRPGIDLCHRLLGNQQLKLYEGVTDGIPTCDKLRQQKKPLSIVDEFLVYRYWPFEKRTRNNIEQQDLPYKHDGYDHACDALRYVMVHLHLTVDFKPSGRSVKLNKKPRGWLG